MKIVFITSVPHHCHPSKVALCLVLVCVTHVLGCTKQVWRQEASLMGEILKTSPESIFLSFILLVYWFWGGMQGPVPAEHALYL
jgi:hypothetical protein